MLSVEMKGDCIMGKNLQYSIMLFPIFWGLLLFSSSCSSSIECWTDADCPSGSKCMRRHCRRETSRRSPHKKDSNVPLEGRRRKGESCDPRDYAWAADRCAKGLRCAMLGEYRHNALSRRALFDVETA